MNAEETINCYLSVLNSTTVALKATGHLSCDTEMRVLGGGGKSGHGKTTYLPTPLQHEREGDEVSLSPSMGLPCPASSRCWYSYVLNHSLSRTLTSVREVGKRRRNGGALVGGAS